MIKTIFDISGLDKQFRLIRLTPLHLEHVQSLQNLILQIQPGDIAVTDTESISMRLAEESGFMLGVLLQDQLIASRSVYKPELEDENFGLDIDIPNNELNQLVHLEMLMVHPNYRGLNLHHWMNIKAYEILNELGNIFHVCATVAPSNYPSVKQLLQWGVAIESIKIKYDNLLRFVCHRDLRINYSQEPKIEYWLKNDQFEEIGALLSQGYRGIKTMKLDPPNKTLYNIGFSREQKNARHQFNGFE